MELKDDIFEEAFKEFLKGDWSKENLHKLCRNYYARCVALPDTKSSKCKHVWSSGNPYLKEGEWWIHTVCDKCGEPMQFRFSVSSNVKDADMKDLISKMNEGYC